MINQVIHGFTRIFGKPANWDEAKHGHCGALAVLDHVFQARADAEPLRSMVSAWEPDPAELLRLQAGASVYLRVLGTVHPPVALWVGDQPEGVHVAAAKI